MATATTRQTEGEAWGEIMEAAQTQPACSCGAPFEHKLDDLCECRHIVADHMIDDSVVFGTHRARRPGCGLCACREQHAGLTT